MVAFQQPDPLFQVENKPQQSLYPNALCGRAANPLWGDCCNPAARTMGKRGSAMSRRSGGKPPAIYGYLRAVFELVSWWAAEHQAVNRARWALRLQRIALPTNDEPFAAIIFCTSEMRSPSISTPN